MNRSFVLTLLLFFSIGNLAAQDHRAQYPGLLSKAYFGVNLGYINYPFSNSHLATGYSAESVKIPHMAVRITLFGYRFTDHLSAQITYMRPFNWVEYKNINGDGRAHTVWMNVGGLTLKGQLPLTRKLYAFGEGGLGLITRNGFAIGNEEIIKDVSYATGLLGGGLQYRINNKWELNAGLTWSPERKNAAQPQTVYISGGFHYRMQPLSAEKVEKNSSRYTFPEQLIQLGYTSNELGYGVNDFVSEGAVPIFWGGEAHLRRGVSVNYQRNVFHSRKVFSLDIGASAGYWETRFARQNFFSLSVYPLLRFTALRTRGADLYLNYSVAGPTFLSKVILDEKNTGHKFTFRDYMGLGVYAGRQRHLNAELNIGHFSNGNIFPSNAGVKIPLSLNLGYAF